MINESQRSDDDEERKAARPKDISRMLSHEAVKAGRPEVSNASTHRVAEPARPRKGPGLNANAFIGSVGGRVRQTARHNN